MSKLGVMGRLMALMLLMWVVACTADSSTATNSKQRAVPATVKMAAARSSQKAPGYDFVPDAGGKLHAMAGDAGAATAVVATSRGMRLSRRTGDGFELGVETASVGRDGAPRGRGVVRERAEGQELVIDREDEVEERLLAGPMGVEHSFEVRARPEGDGPLVMEVAFEGLVPEASGAGDQVLLRDHAGRVRAGYRDLVAADAEGRELEARMQVRGAVVALVIDDAKATYPVRVDPLVWVQEAELGGTVTPAYNYIDYFGVYVAVSGNTAIVGAPPAPFYAPGAAYVFVRSGTTWTQQAVLTGSGESGYSGAFGWSVAIGEGTAVVSDVAAAHIYVQDGTTWTQQAEVTASDGTGSFGSSVAASGGTVVVGASDDTVGSTANQGAAYVFVQDGTTWTQQAVLTASDGAAGDGFGSCVAVNGATAIVASPSRGVSYIFVQDGTTWTQQAELPVGGPVALSGSTAIVGVRSSRAAYVFAQDGTTWMQQAVLTPGDATYDFGYAVALSGGIAIVSTEGGPAGYLGGPMGPGAAYVFAQSGTTWTQQVKLTESADPVADNWFGCSVSVSGGTAIVGGGSAISPEPSAAFIFEQEECEAGTCPPVPDAGSDGSVTVDSGKTVEAGLDSGLSDDAASDAGRARDAARDSTMPRDAARDSGVGHDAAIDSGTLHDAAPDAITSHDAARDSGTTRDATLATDSGARRDAGIHNASTDAGKRAKDASWDATAGLYVSGPVGCGCRIAKDNVSGASPTWLALGTIGLIGRRRRTSRRAS